MRTNEHGDKNNNPIESEGSVDNRSVDALRTEIQETVGGSKTYTKLSKATVGRALMLLRGEEPQTWEGLYGTTRETVIREQLGSEVGFDYDLTDNRSVVFTRSELQEIERAVSQTGVNDDG